MKSKILLLSLVSSRFSKLYQPQYIHKLKMSHEVNAAHAAASTDPAINPNAPTFFDKLVKKEIPSNIIYEDDLW